MTEYLISHKGRYLFRHEDYLGICDGDDCSAQMLSLFEFWTKGKLNEIKQVNNFNRQANATGGSPLRQIDEWLYERIEDFKEGLLGAYGDTYIKQRLKQLLKLGFIQQRPSPNKFDKTNLYKLNVRSVQVAIDKWWSSLWQQQKELELAETLATIDQTNLTPPKTNLTLEQSILSDHLILNNQINNLSKQETPLAPQGGSICPTEQQSLEILEPEPEEDWTRTLTLPTLESMDLVTNQIEVKASVPPSKIFVPKTAEDFEPLRSLYNQHKPQTWAECEKINDSRLKAFRTLYKELGDHTIKTMQEALAYLRDDKWWREQCSSRCIDTFLRRGNVEKFSDSYKASNPNGNYNAGNGRIGVIDPDTGEYITDKNHIAILKGLGRI